MAFNNKPKSRIRYDSRHIRLRTGESEKKGGGYVFRWTTPDGKRHAVYESTLEKLRIREEEIAEDAKDGIREDLATFTVNELYDLWKDLKRGIKDSTFKNYCYMYDMFVKPVFGTHYLVRVKKSTVRAFYNKLADQNGLKISTIDGIHNVLHQIFQVAVDDNMIRYNPTDNMLKELKMARQDRGSRREALTLGQQKLFFNFLSKNSQYRHWYPVFFIMANTGMRVGEITGLRWKDVDLEKGIINVNHTLVYYNHRDDRGCYYSVNTPKTKAGERRIPMTSEVRKAFLEEKEFQEAAGIECMERVDGYDDFIFLNRFGKVHNQASLNRALKRIMKDCNLAILEKKGTESDPVLLPNFSCHVLRHTFCTRAIEAGMSPSALKGLVGHADIKTTLELYVTLTEDEKNKAVSSFQEYVSKEIDGMDEQDEKEQNDATA